MTVVVVGAITKRPAIAARSQYQVAQSLVILPLFVAVALIGFAHENVDSDHRFYLSNLRVTTEKY